jgi:Zn finger protein HypA/HybF involved in hydrogenase expression
MICEKCGSTNISVSNIEGFQVEVCEQCLNVKKHYTDKEKFEKYSFQLQQEIEESKKSPSVTCPYCQSTDTKKISGTSRFMSTGIFGLASKKIGKQWHCNKCKSDF